MTRELRLDLLLLIAIIFGLVILHGAVLGRDDSWTTVRFDDGTVCYALRDAGVYCIPGAE